MKVVNFLLAVMFLFFAFLQVDDPDPLIWILVYGGMAVLGVLAMFDRYFPKVIATLIVIFVAYSLIYINGVREWLGEDNKALLFDDLAKMQHPYIEETREFMGLWICIIVLVFYFVRSRKKAF